MKSKFCALLAIGWLGVLVTGCYSTMEGGSRAGMPLAKDKMEGRYERPLAQVYPAARKVLEFNGTLRGDDIVTKTLEARIDTRYVWVKLDEIEPNLTRVVVQARTKNGGTDIDLAHEIEKQIALQLK
jgi:hypothetical protein